MTAPTELDEHSQRFRKKPVEIEALRYGPYSMPTVEMRIFLAGAEWGVSEDGIVIKTLEGDMLARVGDWIIRGVKGELYPCKPDIFEATYEPASLQPASGAGWRPIETAPKDTYVLLDLGETIPDLVDARAGQYISEYHAAELGETLSASGGWIIWNSGSDWFVIPFDGAHGWHPLPAAPDRRVR